ncbi:phasin family protein [Oceanospirillum multiglobuliferum]|uniref:Phasin domain-containing protein n=1 Tax=Oceanospirillum multiglobuliferum TaxID=64969 RepID=A0A1T4M9K3_9GAMM|nr:hypothetical protein [Oceanospirillum multiglobuliferum]OPX56194.1 hypothetical protein BTE48_04235 [Oceanospirillum multiglobuliferum]SJZ63591.1 phasin family protein [Oceanospirillum multiglobuliferum]
MKTVVDAWSELYKNPLAPWSGLPQQWTEEVEKLMEIEFAAVQQYNHLWLSMLNSCAQAESSDDLQACSTQYAETLAQQHKLFLDHIGKRQKLLQDWREHISEVIR